MDPTSFVDDLGPEKIVYLSDAAFGLKAVVVVDNTARGPGIGGVRMAVDASAEEAFRLARAMTMKNAAAGIPYGGGKSVIVADPHMPEAEKEALIRSFARGIRELTSYIPGPDMGTNERCMAWVRDEIGRAVGLPPEIGGIPLDEIGATGLGVAIAAEVAQQFSDLRIAGARVAVQGFGSVGKHAARFLAERGAVLVAAADSKGTIYDERGLDVGALIALKERGGCVIDHTAGTKLTADEVVGVPCDIWIPAARPDVLTAANVDALQARLVVEGANIPTTPEAEARLHERGVLVLPDFIANAGGVICAAAELRGATEATALAEVREKVGVNTERVLTAAASEGIRPRQAAEAMAEARVRGAMEFRRRP